MLLTVVTFISSVLHYVDNVMFFELYPEPIWLNRYIVDAFWFVMTPVGVAGYIFLDDGRFKLGYTSIYMYAAMNLLSLGHYLIAPPWEIALKINVFILMESFAAIALAAYTAWVHATYGPNLRHPHAYQAV